MWGKRDDMVVHEHDPYNAEPPRAGLVDAITPEESFYVRNHGPVPDIDAQRWRLTVDGLVDHELSLTLAQLQQRWPQHTVTATLQCAGNRRAGLMEVRDIPGQHPWGPGATSTARWTGVRLADVLADAGVRAGGEHVAFAAPDVSQVAEPAQPYGASIELAKATGAEVLLAWAMNGAPLPQVHGGPVRVVVPGYIGARSVKWVERVTVRDTPSDNYFQATAYRLLPPDAGPDFPGTPLTEVALNCDFATPRAGSTVPVGAVQVSGYAYAGERRQVVRVDVSADAGRTWLQTTVAPAESPWTWQHWHAEVHLPTGAQTLLARAWDSTGACQPESPASLWNPEGYVNNSWARVAVDVE